MSVGVFIFSQIIFISFLLLAVRVARDEVVVVVVVSLTARPQSKVGKVTHPLLH